RPRASKRIQPLACHSSSPLSARMPSANAMLVVRFSAAGAAVVMSGLEMTVSCMAPSLLFWQELYNYPGDTFYALRAYRHYLPQLKGATAPFVASVVLPVECLCLSVADSGVVNFRPRQ